MSRSVYKRHVFYFRRGIIVRGYMGDRTFICSHYSCPVWWRDRKDARSMWYRQQYGYDGRVYGTGSRPVGQRGQEEKLCTGAGVSRAVSSDKRFYPVSGTTRSRGTGKTCSLREYIRIDQETPMCGICRYSGSPCGRKTSGTFLRH